MPKSLGGTCISIVQLYAYICVVLNAYDFDVADISVSLFLYFSGMWPGWGEPRNTVSWTIIENFSTGINMFIRLSNKLKISLFQYSSF